MATKFVGEGLCALPRKSLIFRIIPPKRFLDVYILKGPTMKIPKGVVSLVNFLLIILWVEVPTGELVPAEEVSATFTQRDSILFELANRENVATFLLILSDQERREFLQLVTPEEREQWVRNFWKRIDPSSTLLENIFRREFLRRVRYARREFAFPGSRTGMDDRGEIYVRFGEPDARAGGGGSAYARANESWVYFQSVGYGLAFDFVQKGYAFRLVRDLSQAIRPSVVSLEERLRALAELYVRRVYLGGHYSLIGMHYYTWVRSLRREPPPPGYPPGGYLFDLPQEVAVVAGEVSMARALAPPRKLLPKLRFEPLDFNFQYAQFRGPRGHTRLEVYYGLPTGDVVYRPQPDGTRRARLHLALAVLDDSLRQVARVEKRVEVQLQEGEDPKQLVAVNQENFALSPGSYTLGLRMENPEGHRLGIYKLPLTLEDFSGSGLQLSDIQLSLEIRPAREGERRFVKRGLRILPYPYEVIRRDRPIFIYYEVYHLGLDEGGESWYRVTYGVRVERARRGLLGLFGGGRRPELWVTHERRGESREAYEYVSLDVSRLPRGEAELVVRVEDLVRGQVAERKRSCVLK